VSRRNSLERVLYRSAEWQQTGKASLSIPASTSSAATPGSQDMLRRMRVPELDAITLFMAPDNASSESASKRPADQFRAGSRYTNVCSLAEWRAGRARTCDPRRGRPMLNDDDLCDGVRPVPFHAPASDHVWIPAWLSRTVLISWGQPIHRHQELVAARQWRFKSSLPHQTLDSL
jgi:hypothetical protein